MSKGVSVLSRVGFHGWTHPKEREEVPIGWLWRVNVSDRWREGGRREKGCEGDTHKHTHKQREREKILPSRSMV